VPRSAERFEFWGPLDLIGSPAQLQPNIVCRDRWRVANLDRDHDSSSYDRTCERCIAGYDVAVQVHALVVTTRVVNVSRHHWRREKLVHIGVIAEAEQQPQQDEQRDDLSIRSHPFTIREISGICEPAEKGIPTKFPAWWRELPVICRRSPGSEMIDRTRHAAKKLSMI